jgi:MoaA/NifB/PqqE/SkfB family radical SAM enzyme
MLFRKEIPGKMIRYRLARLGMASPGMPMNLTFSVTNRCQSRCKTCKIWGLYQKDPNKRRDELTLNEIDKIFRSMGHIFIFNMSGGEPFLRTDIVDIVRLACKYLTPGIIHIPTNAITSKKIEQDVIAILKVIQSNDPSIQLTVKPSLDHIGEKHDEIRGVKGNFEKVIDLFKRLKLLQTKYPNLHAELGTVISKWNVEDIEEIAGFITALGGDSYRNEIAEQRAEMFNLEDQITPSPVDYEGAIKRFTKEIKANMVDRGPFQRMTHAFRLAYYDLAIRILNENRQVIPCYGGISNAHLSPYGDIWACCTLGYDKPMGNLRNYDYNFRALWNSRQARQVRNRIRKGACACPLANQAYSNILLHGPSLVKTLGNIFIKRGNSH